MAILNNLQDRNMDIPVGEYVRTDNEAFPLRVPEDVMVSPNAKVSLDVGEGEVVKFYEGDGKKGWQSIDFYMGYYPDLSLYPDFPDLANIGCIVVSETDHDFFDLAKLNFNREVEAGPPDEETGEIPKQTVVISQLLPPGRHELRYSNQLDSLDLPNRMRVKAYDKGVRGTYTSAGRQVQYFGHGKTQVWWGTSKAGYEHIDLTKTRFDNQIQGLDVRSGEERVTARRDEVAGRDEVKHVVEYDYHEWTRLERRAKTVGDLFIYMRNGKLVHAVGVNDIRLLRRLGSINQPNQLDDFNPRLRLVYKDALDKEDLIIENYDEFTWENPPPLRHIYRIYDKFIWEKEDVVVAEVMLVDVKQIMIEPEPEAPVTENTQPEV